MQPDSKVANLDEHFRLPRQPHCWKSGTASMNLLLEMTVNCAVLCLHKCLIFMGFLFCHFVCVVIYNIKFNRLTHFSAYFVTHTLGLALLALKGFAYCVNAAKKRKGQVSNQLFGFLWCFLCSDFYNLVSYADVSNQWLHFKTYSLIDLLNCVHALCCRNLLKSINSSFSFHFYESGTSLTSCFGIYSI